MEEKSFLQNNTENKDITKKDSDNKIILIEKLLQDNNTENKDITKKDSDNKIILIEQRIENTVLEKLYGSFFPKYKEKYNKYISFICVKWQLVEKYLHALKKMMFKENIFFNINVINWITHSTIYIKLYDKSYRYRVTKKFGKMLARAIENCRKKIYIKLGIDNKNKVMAECYLRNYNLIFKDSGYEFEMYKSISGKFNVVLYLS